MGFFIGSAAKKMISGQREAAFGTPNKRFGSGPFGRRNFSTINVDNLRLNKVL
jgi:hypothetical protein